jgi:hypothetical protein
MPDLQVKQNDDPQLGFPRHRMREKDLQGHFTQADAAGLEEKPSPPERLREKSGVIESDVENGPPADPAAAPVDVQLARAVEVLKSWNYFDELQKLREKEAPGATDAQAVAATELSKAAEGSPAR